MVTRHIRKSQMPVDDLSRLRDSLKTSFFTVKSHTTPVEELEGVTPELAACHKKLISNARALDGSVAIDVCPPGEAFVSRGVDCGDISGGIVDYRQGFGPQWTAVPAHLEGQERSPKIVLMREKEERVSVVERKIKGGGVRERREHGDVGGMHDEFIAFKQGITLPFYCTGRLMRRLEVAEDSHVWMMHVSRFSSRSIWGACMTDEAQEEFVKMLGMHHLLSSVDGGKRAGVHTPLGVEELTEVPVIDGGVEKRIPVEDYFTSMDYLCVRDLMLYAFEAQARAREQGLPRVEQDTLNRYVRALEANDPYSKRRGNFRSARYLSVLSGEEVAGIEGTSFFSPSVKGKIGGVRLQAGEVIKKVIGLSQLHTVGGDDTRIKNAVERVFYDSKSKEDIDTVLRLIYANHDEDLVVPEESLKLKPLKKGFERDLRQEEEKSKTVMGYLRRVYKLNRDKTERVLRRFTYNLFRDIGALHGAGGYFGGYQPSLVDAGVAEEFGASLGGSAECRNVDILGNKHDLVDDVFIPFLALTRKVPDERTVREMQLKDLFLAEVSLGKFSTLLTGGTASEEKFGLADWASTTYSCLEFPQGRANRVDSLEDSLKSLRRIGGSDGEWKSLQAYRERVYWDFFDKGAKFKDSLGKH